MVMVTCPSCAEEFERVVAPGSSIRCPSCGLLIAVPGERASVDPGSSRSPVSTGDPFAEAPLRFVVTVASSRGSRVVELDPGSIVEIGRQCGPLTDLCADNISSRHAELRVTDRGLVVVDVGNDGRGSTNGTSVDGIDVAPGVPTPVSPGSTISCASDPPLTLRVEVLP